MSWFFKKIVDTILTNDNINNICHGNVRSFLCYERLKDVLTENELRETQKSILLLTKYLIEKNKFILPSTIENGAKIYRAGKLNSGDANNGYFPISKSVATNCPSPADPQEPIWFGLEPLIRYLNLSEAEPYGLITGRQIKDIGKDLERGRTNEMKFNLLVNISTNDKVTTKDGSPAYLLSKSLQVAINKAILIPIARKYCGAYSKTNYSRDLTYDYILQNAASFNFTKTVAGYDCDAQGRYTGGTIESLLKCWDYNTGTRFSIYNEDRIQIQVMFEVFEWVEQIINSVPEPFNRTFITQMCSKNPKITNQSKFNLIGWFCKDTPRGRDNSSFPGEVALSIKTFTAPFRYEIFNKQKDDCKPHFYVYDKSGPKLVKQRPGPRVQPVVQQNHNFGPQPEGQEQRKREQQPFFEENPRGFMRVQGFRGINRDDFEENPHGFMQVQGFPKQHRGINNDDFEKDNRQKPGPSPFDKFIQGIVEEDKKKKKKGGFKNLEDYKSSLISFPSESVLNTGRSNYEDVTKEVFKQEKQGIQFSRIPSETFEEDDGPADVVQEGENLEMKYSSEGKYDDNKEYYYSKEPERQDSDLFQVFFANNPKEEEKYTDEPEEFAEIIKKYIEQEKQNSNLDIDKISSTVQPQFIRARKLSKKHKRKSFKKKISKKYIKKS